ncbi:MAG: hypothetical protein NVS3B23_08850 [Candidatus Saccharimonadales bacterium]
MDITEYYESPRINLTGPVDSKMIEDLDRQVKITEFGDNVPVVVTLTSGGGSVGYARAIYDELLLLQTHGDLTLVARGICLSAAVTIAMAFPHDRRLATPNTKFLIHQGSRESSPAIVGPLAARKNQFDNFKVNFKDDQEEGDWVVHVIAKSCNKTIKDVEKKSRNGLWLVGQKAVQFGLVSSLIDKESTTNSAR